MDIALVLTILASCLVDSLKTATRSSRSSTSTVRTSDLLAAERRHALKVSGFFERPLLGMYSAYQRSERAPSRASTSGSASRFLDGRHGSVLWIDLAILATSASGNSGHFRSRSAARASVSLARSFLPSCRPPQMLVRATLRPT